MPGPSNKKKKQKAKCKEKRSKSVVEAVHVSEGVVGRTLASPIARKVEEVMFEPPFIHDPGNGPRVRDVKMFIKSSFAQPVAQEDELCQEFGQKEVLEMLMTILPEDTALVGGRILTFSTTQFIVGMKVLWYNKSRAKNRICPACLRLYNIGDELDNLTRGGILGEDAMGGNEKVVLSARQLREQELSGFCGSSLLLIEKGRSNIHNGTGSPVCFIMASGDFMSAIESAWGHTGDEMSDESWAVLNAGVVGGGELRRVLGMVVKMTRLHDLGLLELCFE